MSLKLTQYEQINLIHSTHLPLEVGVAVTTEPLEVEEANEKCGKCNFKSCVHIKCQQNLYNVRD